MTDLVPLGDQVVLVYCADESAALRLAAAARKARPRWLVDLVQAYTSVAIFFDLEQIDSCEASEWVRRFSAEEEQRSEILESRTHRIPCCYEFQRDLERVVERTGLAREEAIRLHWSTEYTVYALGFCPGFPYLGYLPPALCGVPRLEQPRLRVEPGSVGLTGRQTGVYPEARPGGWNLIGRTPLQLVDVEDGYFPLRTGDRVEFERIDEAEFQRLLGQRL